jgi:hypothetical protein
MAAPDDHAEEPIQVWLHPVLREPFEAWLAERGLHLARIPSRPDDLPTYAVTPDGP